MKSNKDAYGEELWDYYKGETSHPEMVERDDGLISVGDTYSGKVYFSEHKNWPPQDKKAIALVTGKKVLDVGCGAGVTELPIVLDELLKMSQ